MRWGALWIAMQFVCACGARTALRTDDASLDARDASTAVLPDADALLLEVPDDLAVVAQLDGLRWELPCTMVQTADICSSASRREVSAVLRGIPGARYRVTARFRGVVELKSFTGGTPRGLHWQEGGTPSDDSWNLYGLRVSSPPSTNYLNRGSTGRFFCVAVDYVESFEVDVGATVLLTADSINALEVRNLDERQRPLVVEGIAPAPRAFDGQFLQMDVLQVVRLR